MGKIFMDNVNTKESSLALVFLGIITVVFFGVKTILPIVICILASLYLTRYITKKIGGMTGDTIGFIIEITQIIFLFSIYILRSWI
jgi:adenosylcobinamide-GDP ribazoletransferase